MAPPPLPSFLFFCSRPNLLDELARKRLLRRLMCVGLTQPRGGGNNCVTPSPSSCEGLTTESSAEAEELYQSLNVRTCLVIVLSFPFCFRLRQSGFHLIVNDRVINRVRKKWNRSDSFDSAYDANF